MSFISDMVLAALCLLLYILTHKLIQKDQVQELRLEIEGLKKSHEKLRQHDRGQFMEKSQEFTERIEELVSMQDIQLSNLNKTFNQNEENQLEFFTEVKEEINQVKELRVEIEGLKKSHEKLRLHDWGQFMEKSQEFTVRIEELVSMQDIQLSNFKETFNQNEEKQLAFFNEAKEDLQFQIQHVLTGFDWQHRPCETFNKKKTCYFFTNRQGRFDEMTKFCQDVGMRMVVLETWREYKFIADYITENTIEKDIYVSLLRGEEDKDENKDKDEEENKTEFNWVDSEHRIPNPLDYDKQSPWAPGEPNDTGDCVYFWALFLGQWDDHRCTVLRYTICEYNSKTLTVFNE